MSISLTKADIVEAIYTNVECNRSRVEVKNSVESLIALIKESFFKDGALLISGFGKFTVYNKPERQGRNPQTNSQITLPCRKVISFHLSRKFRAELNGEEW